MQAFRIFFSFFRCSQRLHSVTYSSSGFSRGSYILPIACVSFAFFLAIFLLLWGSYVRSVYCGATLLRVGIKNTEPRYTVSYHSSVSGACYLAVQALYATRQSVSALCGVCYIIMNIRL
jgi:hypothetical protein